MTIKEIDNGFDVSCDHCGTKESFEKNVAVLFSESIEMSEVIESLKDDGWRIYLSSSGEWNHMCPECNEYDDEEE